jgi:hypothetical protein
MERKRLVSVGQVVTRISQVLLAAQLAAASGDVTAHRAACEQIRSLWRAIRTTKFGPWAKARLREARKLKVHRNATPHVASRRVARGRSAEGAQNSALVRTTPEGTSWWARFKSWARRWLS